jgi:acetyl esterase/lipase
MARICIFVTLLMAGLPLAAQTADCTPGRYQTELFTVGVTSAVQFGQAAQPTLLNPNATQTLYVDVYQPQQDSQPLRPLVVWAFGGGFTVGSRLSPDIVDLCNRLARTGYVCASIDYRLSTDLLLNATEEKLYTAVMKAAHDMRAALRFFWKSARTGGNPYRIDTNRIFVGGVSAGAITALHLAYLDSEAEIPASAQAMAAANGGLEGLSGNPGYPSRVAGVLSLSGALGDTLWLDSPTNPPFCALHGTQDDVVPYATGGTSLFPQAPITLHGGYSLHQRATHLGLAHTFRPYPGEGHTPFILGTNTAANMDTTYWTVRDFLYPLVCGPATAQPEGAPLAAIALSPNPSAGLFTLHGLAAPAPYTVHDAQGRAVATGWAQGTTPTLQLGHLPPGAYLLRLLTATPTTHRLLIAR